MRKLTYQLIYGIVEEYYNKIVLEAQVNDKIEQADEYKQELKEILLELKVLYAYQQSKMPEM